MDCPAIAGARADSLGWPRPDVDGYAAVLLGHHDAAIRFGKGRSARSASRRTASCRRPVAVDRDREGVGVLKSFQFSVFSSDT